MDQGVVKHYTAQKNVPIPTSKTIPQYKPSPQMPTAVSFKFSTTIIYVYVYFDCIYVCLPCTYVQCPQKPEMGVLSLGSIITDIMRYHVDAGN